MEVRYPRNYLASMGLPVLTSAVPVAGGEEMGDCCVVRPPGIIMRNFGISLGFPDCTGRTLIVDDVDDARGHSGEKR